MGQKVGDNMSKKRRSRDGASSKSHSDNKPSYKSWFMNDGGGFKGKTPTSPPVKHEPSCEHWRSKFELLDGLQVSASAVRDSPSYGEVDTAPTPDIGFYATDAYAKGRVLVSPGLNPPVVAELPKVCVWPWPD